jgi:uncharacterized damage-inducible protein DinB
MLREIAAGFALALVSTPLIAQDAASFKQDYLWELDYASSQLIALAEAMPAEKYAWRPGEGVRSVSEVYAHVALGNFFLLDILGQPAPEDLYGKLAGQGRERCDAIVKRNEAMEKSFGEKARVVELLKRSFEAPRKAVEGLSAADWDKRVDFFGRSLSARAVYMRMLAHAHEHMGQSVAYARVNGVVPPWSRPRQ